MRKIHPATPAEFQMGDKVYRMRLSLHTLKVLEQEHQIPILRGPESITEAVRDPAKLALIVYHGLKANHPEITLEWVEDTFDVTSLGMLVPVISQALSGKEVADPPNAPPPEKPNGIGLLNGPSGDTTSDSPTVSGGTLTSLN